MLSAVKSKWITALAGVITAVVLASVAIGLASPDGSVGDHEDATSSPSTKVASSPSTTPAAPSPRPHAGRAPSSVRKPWPGRPGATTVRGSTINWCPAVRTSGAGEAERIFGKAAVRKAACTAVRFVFDKRYSRLSLPRDSYAPEDLDFVLPALAPATVAAYRPRIDTFLASSDSVAAGEALGLVLFHGAGTTSGAKHAAAGHGRVFYGKAFSTAGYKHRAVWVNPTWSRVGISVDHSKAEPRIMATLDASAAVPVFNPSARRDDMMTVPTHAKFFLRSGPGQSWKIGGWTITSGTYDYTPLRLK
jgi:hypothetical protein